MRARSAPSARQRAARRTRAARSSSCCTRGAASTIAYRRRLIDSPSYTLNHEEVEKALEEGIRFAEGLTPLAIEVDAHGHACALDGLAAAQRRRRRLARVRRARRFPRARSSSPRARSPTRCSRARTPRTSSSTASISGCSTRTGSRSTPVKGLAKPAQPAVLTELRADGRAMSFFGDLHPSFSGNVVKAMASAKQGYPIVSRMLAQGRAGVDASRCGVLRAPRSTSCARRSMRVERLTPTIVEVVVRAPAAARRFQPGPVLPAAELRDARAARVDGTRLAMEGLALTGAWVDREQGLVSTIVLEMGGSSDLCALLQPGEPVVLMGPTGTPTEIAGGRNRACWSAAGSATRCCSRSAQAFRARRLEGALLRRLQEDDRPLQGRRRSRRRPTWSSGAATRRRASRRRGRRIARSSATSCRRCARTRRARSASRPIPFAACDRIIAIGSDRMMAAVGAARHSVLAPYLKPGHRAIGRSTRRCNA